MNSNSDNFSVSSEKQQGRCLHSDKNVLDYKAKGIIFTEYFEVMSPGLEHFTIESGGASASTSRSEQVFVTSESPAFKVEAQNLPFKKRPFADLNSRDPYIPPGFEHAVTSGEAMGLQSLVYKNDSVPVTLEKLTRREPGIGGPAKCLSEIGERRMNVFKHILVERIKILFDPTWKMCPLSKVDYKAIVKKTTTKVLESITERYIPDTPQKIDRYFCDSDEKILKLVKEYYKRQTAQPKGFRQ